MIPQFSLGEVRAHIPLAQPLAILDLRSTPAVREHRAAELTGSLYIPSGADTPLKLLTQHSKTTGSFGLSWRDTPYSSPEKEPEKGWAGNTKPRSSCT